MTPLKLTKEVEDVLISLIITLEIVRSGEVPRPAMTLTSIPPKYLPERTEEYCRGFKEGREFALGTVEYLLDNLRYVPPDFKQEY